MNLSRLSVVGLLMAVLLAACTSAAASPTSEPTAEPTPTPEPTPTEAAQPPGDGALPSFGMQGDPELASRFPDTMGGQPLQMFSMRGDAFLGSGGEVDPSMQAFLDSVGADLQDVSVAFGSVSSETGDSFLTAGAFRVLGASQDDLEREFIAASEQDGTITGWSQTSMAGKDVWTADSEGMAVVLYAKDDTIYYLTGDAALADELLAQLP